MIEHTKDMGDQIHREYTINMEYLLSLAKMMGMEVHTQSYYTVFFTEPDSCSVLGHLQDADGETRSFVLESYALEAGIEHLWKLGKDGVAKLKETLELPL